MVERGNAENKVERMILNGQGVGRAYLKLDFVGQSLFLRVSSRNFDHHGERSIPLNRIPGMAFDKKWGRFRDPFPHQRPSLLDSLGQHPFENPLAGESPYRLAIRL